MLRSIVLFAVFTLAIPVHAQDKPLTEAPKPKAQFNKKLFRVGVSLFAAAKTADAITTRQALDSGGWENNPRFGRHSSPAKHAGIDLAFFAGESAVFYLTEHNRHSWVRWTGGALLSYSIADHANAAACNAGLNPNVRVVQSCGPLGF